MYSLICWTILDLKAHACILMGESMGGYAAWQALVYDTRAFDAAIICAGYFCGTLEDPSNAEYIRRFNEWFDESLIPQASDMGCIIVQHCFHDRQSSYNDTAVAVDRINAAAAKKGNGPVCRLNSIPREKGGNPPISISTAI